MSIIPQVYDKKMSLVLKYIEEHGDLTFISEKGHGKTVACENLAKKIIENPKNRLIVFETFPKWCNEFPQASFLEIPKEWIVETSQVINLENTWIQHERGFTVLHGDIISQFLKENQNCIFLITHDDIEAIAFFEYSVIYRFYRQKYDLLRKGLPIKEHVYFILEEAQNSLDSKILSSKLFRRYRKLFSEMRNMGLHAILITQRLQDLSTYFRCRTSLAIGKIQLDDYDLKLKRMLSPIGNQKEILKLPIGSFYFSGINDTIAFPKFETAKPKMWIPKISEPKPIKKKSLLRRLWDWIPPKPITYVKTQTSEPEPQETTEQEFQKEDSEDLLDEDWLDIEDE